MFFMLSILLIILRRTCRWLTSRSHGLPDVPAAGAGIGLGALPPHREATDMAHAAVRTDILMAFDVHHDLTAELALDAISFLNDLPDAIDFIRRQVFRALDRVDLRRRDDAPRAGDAHAVNIRKRVDDLLRIGNDGA